MSTRVLIKVGEPLRLNLQLSDGEESLPLRVMAFLKDEEGQNLTSEPIELLHVGLGLFKNFEHDMPDLPEVTAQYVVYEEDGLTHAPYSVDADIFSKYEPVIHQDVNIESLISKLTTESMVVAIGHDEQMSVDLESP